MLRERSLIVASAPVAPGGRPAGLGAIAVVAAFGALSLGSTLAKSAGSPGAVVAMWRFAIGALIWHAVVAASAAHRARAAGLPARRGVSGAAWRRAALPGVAFGINLSCFFSGVERTPIAHAEFISACAPVILVPLGARRLGEGLPRRLLGWGTLALTGVALILGTESAAATSVTGDLLVAGSVLAWVAYLLLARAARQEIGTADFMAVMSTTAFATTAAVTLATAGPAAAVVLTARGWLLVAALAVTSGVAAHGAIAWAQQRVAVGVVSMLQLAQPALGVLWAAVFLGEAVRPAQVVGMVGVLAAVGAIARRVAR